MRVKQIIRKIQSAIVLIGLPFLLPACNPILELGIESTPLPLPTSVQETSTPFVDIPTVIPETPIPPSPTVEVQPTTMPTPEPTSTESANDTTNRYTNDAYGFSFTYPGAWQYKEDTHTILLGMDSVSLFIGFKWLAESVDVWSRSGIPAGDWETQGEVTILGESVQREALVYDGKVVAVFYGGAPSQIQAGDIIFSIAFDVLDPNIDENTLKAAQIMANQIVESIEFVDTSALKPGEIPVIGWYGSVHSDADYGDYLKVLPEGTGAFGVQGIDKTVEAQILTLLDKEPPNKYAHFWGKLVCGVDDYNTCTLTASKIRPDGPGPLFDPDPVEGWVGTIHANPELAQFEDTYIAAGVYPIPYGIWSEDSTIEARIIQLRDSGIHIRLWGQLFCGVVDANGCQIQVSQLETLE